MSVFNNGAIVSSRIYVYSSFLSTLLLLELLASLALGLVLVNTAEEQGCIDRFLDFRALSCRVFLRPIRSRKQRGGEVIGIPND